MDSFTGSVSPPDFRAILVPFLSGLPGAAISTQPATTLLPLLSPILRHRVQLLSSASAEPWIRLLTYDADKVPQLTAIAQSGCLEPHPVSGEIEVDWDYDLEVRHKRLDEETLQIYLVLHSFDLFFRLVHCTDDEEGGGDGWRVGEVGAAGDPSASLASFGGFSSIWEAEKAFKTHSSSSSSTKVRQPDLIGANGSLRHDSPAATPVGDVDDDAHHAGDDDDYWGRYDATSAQQTPAATDSPAPQSMARVTGVDRSASAEDAYYAQYDSVQPAMDNHDPEEEPERTTSPPPPPPLGLGRQQHQHQHQQDQEQQQDDSVDGQPTSLSETSGAWTLADAGGTDADGGGGGGERSRSRSLLLVANDERAQQLKLMHPRPESSASSQGSLTVARLEETAERHDQSAFGVKQHISRSLRSLFLLSRASGIDRDEFERMVRTELDVLGMVEDSI